MKEEFSQEKVVEKTGRFNTFSGVFRPNVLTILGLSFYLLVGWIVGQAGVWQALGIIFLANLVTLFTGLSISTIATGMKIKAGGNYYMISRSLGQEIGGTIGIQLYISQAISVAFYIIGFTKVFTSIPMFAEVDPQLLGTAVVLIFTFIVFLYAHVAMKLHFVMFAILLCTIASFFTGGWGEFQTTALTSHYDVGENFWTVFAIFFPAVTGIAIGASMSGDLKKPEENIPRGTMYSIVCTAAVYLLAAVWYGTHGTPDELKNNETLMMDIALFPTMILVGMLSSTLSSTLSSMLAAPRILQAIANDGIVPSFFAHKLGSKKEPGVAILITFIIAVIVIWAGDLRDIAPILSMFFLNTYGMTNLVALVETLVQNPNFRPKFKVHPIFYFLGVVGCYGSMFLISPTATGIAVGISVLVYFGLAKRNMEQKWGDVRSGIWKSIAKLALFKIEEEEITKNWRLNIVAFSKHREQRSTLLDFVKRLKYGHGVTTFMELITYCSEDGKDFISIRLNKLKKVKKQIQEQDVTAFTEVVLVPDVDNAMITISQANGTGSMEPNTVLLGLSRTKGGRLRQFDNAQKINELNKTVMIYKKNTSMDEAEPYPDNVDIWWKGDKGNFSIMLMLAYLMTRHKTRNPGKIRVIRMVKNSREKTTAMNYINNILTKTNINAEIKTIETTEDKFYDFIPEESKDNGTAMVGFSELPELEDGAEYMDKINKLSKKTNALLLVSGANLKKSSSNIVPMENLLNI